MTTAILGKTYRDYALTMVLCIAGVLAFGTVSVRMILEGERDLPFLKSILDRPLTQMLVKLAVGADLRGELNPTGLSTVALSHPLLYSLTWALLLSVSTGLICGEIGRGTADTLLSLPASRWSIYAAGSTVLLTGVVLVSAAPFVGLWLGERVFPLASPFRFDALWTVAINYFALNLSIAMVGLCVSTFLSSRGAAVGVLLTALLISNLIDLLAQFWPLVKHISPLGFLYYYKPLLVLRAGGVPWTAVGVLAGASLIAWTVGLIHFSRRDIPAA